MDKLHQRLKQQYYRLLEASIVKPLSPKRQQRLHQLEEYLTTVSEVDEILKTTEETRGFAEQEQCYSVYEY